MTFIQHIFDKITGLTIGGEPIYNILLCLGIIIGIFIIKRPLAGIFARVFATVANKFVEKKHSQKFRVLLTQPLELLFSTILFYVAVNQLTTLLNFPIFKRHIEGKLSFVIRLSDIADKAFLLFIILFTTLVCSRIIDFIFYTQIEKAYEEKNREKEQLFPLVKDVAKIALWIIGSFWILGTVFNVNIPALITGLGIGGVAIALAAKESVENFFASFIILTDKPFSVGDTIRMDKYEGTIERVGFRSTRMISGEGSIFIIPNKKLIGENVENLTLRVSRKIKLQVNLNYTISAADAASILLAIKNQLAQLAFITAPIEASIESFNEASFQILVSYYLPTPLPEQSNLAHIKSEVNFTVYAIIAPYQQTATSTIPINSSSLETDHSNGSSNEE